jgi:hypothetical protein
VLTPPRQVWLFELGCWLAFATAVVQVAGHLMRPAPSALAASLAGVTAPYLIFVPGQDAPTWVQAFDGYSVSMPLLLATLGAAGLAVQKRGYQDATLLRGVARAYAVGSAVLLVVAVISFFSLQAFFIATMALCFALAAVTEG